ncbi:hypothetical protein AVEN_108383-1 [Araneus ventricosus]|uniref:Peptidase aspartic putative domain-containing protein n=1 Tax=Araneus ventricosus TaxID=182803 RepID=A0A4Y2CWD1_ARAVE|nr:hypothetical protein AVEN_108383-1 [Araneus ventricosus]
MSIFSFDPVKPVGRTHEVGVITLISRYDSEQQILVEILIADTITTAPVETPNADILAGMQLRSLNLSNTCENGSKIEVLIGGDVFWRITDGSRVEKINNTVTGVPTIFGFAL